MNTPIYDFVTKYADKNIIRLHMPGHKGRGLPVAKFDITEISGADSLFEADGIIKESEHNASELFGTAATYYSTQGSTLGIQTMMGLVKSFSEDPEPVIIAGRNAHKAFINACILLGFQVEWVYPKYIDDSILSGEITVKMLKEQLDLSKKKPVAIYITSPDYFGKVSDIRAIADFCHENDILLLVDNAHGAYQCFLEENKHPIYLGADMCCDSAHKTLPVLTSGAYLHISKNADIFFMQNAKTVMSMFSSTSPSYFVLSSLDLCNKYIFENIRQDLKSVIPMIQRLRNEIQAKGYEVFSDEPLKLTINANSIGLYGYQLAEQLSFSDIEVEYFDDVYIVMMFSTYNTDDEFERISKAFSKIQHSKMTLQRLQPVQFSPESVMSLREAAFCKSEQINVNCAKGRICSKTVVACPPGIPIVVSGEVITSDIIKILQRYSIFMVNVVKSKM